jgi:hypothetical protein
MKLARRKFLHLAAGAGALPFAPHRKPARRPDFLAARPGTHSSAYSPPASPAAGGLARE